MPPSRRFPSKPPAVRRLTDEELLDALTVLTRPGWRAAADEARTVSAAADVELELARRGIRPAEAVPEPTPASLALRRFASEQCISAHFSTVARYWQPPG